MVGAQSDSMGTDARDPEPTAGDKSGGPAAQISLEVESVFSSNADECAASVAGTIHPSSDGVICSRLKSGAAVGAISRVLPDGRSKPCSSWLFGAPGVGPNPSKIKSPGISAV